MKDNSLAVPDVVEPSPTARSVRVLPAERRMILVAGDVVLVGFAALATAHLTWQVDPVAGKWLPATSWNLALAVVLLALVGVTGAQHLGVALRLRTALPGLVVATVGTAISYLTAFFIVGRPIFTLGRKQPLDFAHLPITDPPRLAPAAFLVISLGLLILWRGILARLLAADALRHRALVVGAGASARRLLADLREIPHHYLLLGLVDDDPAKAEVTIGELGVVSDRRGLVETATRLGVQEVILATTGTLHAEMLEELIRCWELGIAVRPMPAVYEELTGRVPVQHLGQKWFLAPFWNKVGLPGLEAAAKRLLDLVIGAIGLVVTLLLTPWIALAIRVEGRGPIFYVQERLGRAGRPFQLVKFRSMRPDAELDGEARWASRGDPRITLVGSMLRRTRLDELPQFWNVVRGDMSIVGPRPERASFIARLEQEIPFYRMRLAVKPGMTGWAQIRYPYGNTVEDALRKLEYDLYYVKHYGLSLDLVIVVRTVGVVLTFRGS